MTYSISAIDRATGRWGVAVQSCVPAVGSRVPAVVPGAGAIAVQAGSPSWYRQPLSQVLAYGRTAEEVVSIATALPGAEAGQVAVVDAAGRGAAHTGPACTPAAVHTVGDGVVAAANLCSRDDISDAMIRAFETTEGSFERRLVAALAAGEATGGDVRGRQSAALLVSANVLPGAVVTGGAGNGGTDLRVDDDMQPVGELARLLAVREAHEELSLALDEGCQDRWRDAATRLTAISGAPGEPHVTAWTAVALILAGAEAEALPYVDTALERNPRFPEYLRREPLLAGHLRRDAVLALVRARAVSKREGVT